MSATVVLSPIGGAGQQFFDNNGNVLSGGKLYSYIAGTTTPLTTYTSNTGVTPNANPIILGSDGRVSGDVWLIQGSSYKFILKTSVDVTLGSWDNISGSVTSFNVLTVFNVITYGADPTGMTDSTVACQAAHTAAGAGTVYYPPGTYLISSAITCSSGSIIEGGGPGTIIKAANASNTNIFSGSGKSNVLFRNFKIDGNKANQSSNGWGIDLNNCTDCVVDNIVVTAMYGYPVVFRGNSARCIISNLYADNCGFGPTFTGTTECIINNSIIRATTALTAVMGGIFISGSPRSQAVNNLVDTTNANGIWVNNADDTLVSGNTIKSCGGVTLGEGRGIMHGTTSSARCRIIDNYITGSYEQAIFFSTSTDALIQGNACLNNNTGIGSVVLEAGNGSKQIIGNNISGTALATTKGIYTSGSYNVIANNVVTGMPSHGIQLWGTQQTTCSGNICRNNGGNGIDLNQSAGGPYLGNTVVGNRCVDDQGPKTQLLGISVSNRFTSPVIVGNDVSGNTTNGFSSPVDPVAIGNFSAANFVLLRNATTTPVTCTVADDAIFVKLAAPGAVAVTLPATPTRGQRIVIKDGTGDAAANNITVSAAAGNIDGAATNVIATNYAARTYVYTGTQWSVF